MKNKIVLGFLLMIMINVVGGIGISKAEENISADLLLPEARVKISGQLAFEVNKYKTERLKENQNIEIQQTAAAKIKAARDLRAKRAQAKAAPKMVRVVLELSSDKANIDSQLISYGVNIKSRYGNLIEADVPLEKIEIIAKDIKEVSYIRKPLKFFPTVVISEGVALTGAGAFQSFGYKGQGIKVAVIDVGFKGLTAAIANGELPANVITKDYSGNGIETEYVHGAACAEIIYDIAPQAQFYLIKITSDTQFYNAVDYCVSQGVKIVSCSLGIVDLAPGNGTGPICNKVNGAKAKGILWVNAAGNEASGNHWQGLFTDSDNNKVHEFAPYIEYASIVAWPDTDENNKPLTDELTVILRWDDWPNPTVDYDLYLYDYTNGKLIASSEGVQNGSGYPFEVITVDIPNTDPDAYYYYKVFVKRKDNAPKGIDMELYTGSTCLIGTQTASSSLMEPADAEGSFTVGAIEEGKWATGPQAVYSSQGPTNAWAGAVSRIKPDICGPTLVSTYTYGQKRFGGTSSSAPHVAGVAALLLSMYPNMTVDQLRAELESKVVDMGAIGKDNIYGVGRLNLPDPKNYLSSIVINEFVPNPDGANSEWIELYNKGAQAVNIGGCWIDDVIGSGGSPQKVPDGTIIQPGGYYVHTVDTGDGYLNNPGDTVNFIAPDKTTVVDTKTFAGVSGNPDQSIYRYPDGGSWASGFDNTPTKGAANDGPSAATNGSLKFTVKDKNNSLASGALILLYDSTYTAKLFEVTTLADGTYLFNNNLSAGAYNYEVYHLASDPAIRSFWAAGGVSVMVGQTTEKTVKQSNPYITSILVKDQSGSEVNRIQAGNPLTINITVKNDSNQARETFPKIQIDKEKDSDYLYKAEAPKITIAQGGSQDYTLTYTPSTDIADNTVLYLNVDIVTVSGLNQNRTDRSNWSKSFTVTNTLPGSLKFTVKDKNNSLASGALILLYDSTYTTKLFEVTTLADGTYLFNNNLSAGAYNYEVYHPASDPAIRSFWSVGSVSVTAGQTTDKIVTQNNPYVKNILIKDANGQPKAVFNKGEAVKITVEVKNDELILRKAYSVLYLDGDKMPPYYGQISKANEPLDLPAGQTAIFNFDFTIPSDLVSGAILYVNAAIFSKYGAPDYQRTDFGDWRWQFKVETPVNQPPVVSIIPDYVFDEDTTKTINLDDFVADPDNADSEIAWSVSGNVKIAVNINPATRQAALTPAKDWNGSENIAFTAKDPGNLSDSKTFKATVAPVNDPPTISGVPNQKVQVGLDVTLDVSGYINDIDNDKTALIITQNSKYARVEGQKVIFSYLPGITSEQVTITVSDGQLPASQTITVEVGQAGSGELATIYGRVKNPQGLAMPNITVAFIAPAGAWATAVTNSNGYYIFENIPPGFIYTFIAFPSSGATYAATSIQVNIPKAGIYADKDIMFFDGGISITGKVREAANLQPLKDAPVRYQHYERNIWFTTKTLQDGSYSIANMPKGEARISVRPESIYGGETISRDFQSSAINVDFALEKSAAIKGKAVKQETGEGFAGVNVDLWSKTRYAGINVFCDANGSFTINDSLVTGICGLKAMPHSSTGYAWSMPSPCDSVYLVPNVILSDVTLNSKKGAFVKGIVKDAQGNSVNGLQFRLIGKQAEALAYTDASGRFEFRAPVGKSSIAARNYPLYCGLDRIIEIDDPSKTIDLSGITVYTKETGAKLTGRIDNSGNYNKAGNFVVMVYRAGYLLNEETLYFATNYTAACELKAQGAYELTAIPPNADYDIYLGLYKLFQNGAYSMVLRDARLNIPAGRQDVNLNYTSEGGTISGRILDENRNSVLGAYAVLKDNATGKYAGLAVTDQNGNYIFYNALKGDYKISASHSLYVTSSSVRAIVNDGANSAVEDIILQRSFSPPQIKPPIPDIVTDEDTSKMYVLSPYEWDALDSGEQLTWSISGVDAGLFSAAIDKPADKLIITPVVDKNGSDWVTFTLTNSHGLTASQDVKIIINPVNDPPVFEQAGDKMADEGKPLSFTVNALDVDGDALVYSAANLPPGAGFDANTRAFRWTPSFTQARQEPYVVTFAVSDGKLSASMNINIMVKDAAPPQEPPVRIIAPQDGQTVSGLVNAQAKADGATFVNFYIDGKLAALKFSPFAYEWNTKNLHNGFHTIYARAFYLKGFKWIQSDAVKVKIDNAQQPAHPALNIITPQEGQTVKGIVKIEAEILNGAASRVYFYIDNKLQSYDVSAPYQYQWETTRHPNGSHTIKVSAYISETHKYITRTCAVRVDN